MDSILEARLEYEQMLLESNKEKYSLQLRYLNEYNFHALKKVTDSYNNEFLSKEDSLYKGFGNYPMKEQNGWKIRINETDEEICDHVFDD